MIDTDPFVHITRADGPPENRASAMAEFVGARLDLAPFGQAAHRNLALRPLILTCSTVAPGKAYV